MSYVRNMPQEASGRLGDAASMEAHLAAAARFNDGRKRLVASTPPLLLAVTIDPCRDADERADTTTPTRDDQVRTRGVTHEEAVVRIRGTHPNTGREVRRMPKPAPTPPLSALEQAAATIRKRAAQPRRQPVAIAPAPVDPFVRKAQTVAQRTSRV